MSNQSDRENFGEGLRKVRKAQGLSLIQVEERSCGEFKAVVLGSYERGARAISMERCIALARFYRVPVATFFGQEADALAPIDHKGQALIFDLKLIRNRATNKLRHDLALYTPLARYLEQLCGKRGDWNGEVLTVRESDRSNLELILGLSSKDFATWTDFEGIRLRFKGN